MGKNSRVLMPSLGAIILLTAVARGDDWQPPKDGVYTEKQFTSYVQVQKGLIDTARAAGKAIEGSQSSAAALAMLYRTSEKFKASLAAHGMGEAEYEWVGGAVWKAYGQVMRDDIVQEAQV